MEDEFLARMGSNAFLVALVFLLLSVASARAEKVTPSDNTSGAPGFGAFKQKLLTAIEHRDAQFIESILSKNLIFSSAHEDGFEGFHRAYDLKDPNCGFWTEMEHVMKLGGCYDGKQRIVWYPYVYFRWPDTLSTSQYCAITSKNVAVHSKPDAAASTVATLSYDVVKIMGGSADRKWMKVEVSKKVSGYVPQKDVQMQGWTHVSFEKVDGQWKLTTYVASQ